jgi:hypothetical protein
MRGTHYGSAACGRDCRNPRGEHGRTGFQPCNPVAPAMAGIRNDGGWVSPRSSSFSSSLARQLASVERAMTGSYFVATA